MGLLLPDDYPHRARNIASAARGSGALRVGIVNLMPEAEVYEPMLLSALDHAEVLIEPVWLRLRAHAYASSDGEHLARFYRDAEGELARARLDALIITGAPVEELAFEEVLYFGELAALLERARRAGVPTLGLCWGAMALAKLLGIEKHGYERKLFGVYPLQRILSAHRWFSPRRQTFACAQSRHAGARDDVLEQAERYGVITLLAHSRVTGYSILESRDGLWCMHFGHPEYTTARLRFEYQRDRRLGRSDVAPPIGFDPERVTDEPLTHGADFFRSWLEYVRRHADAPLLSQIGG